MIKIMHMYIEPEARTVLEVNQENVGLQNKPHAYLIKSTSY